MNKVNIQSIRKHFINNKKIYRHIIALTIIFIIYIGFCDFVYNRYIKRIDKFINYSETGQVVGELKNGDVITQEIRNVSGTIYSISFASATYGQPNAGSGKLLISLYDKKDNKLIGHVIGEMSKIADNSFTKFYFDKEIFLDDKTDIILRIEISGMQTKDKFTAYIGESTENESMKLNEHPENGTLRIVLEKSEYDYFAKALIFTMVVLAVFIALMYYLIFIKKNVKIELLYLVCAVFLGGLFFVFVPEYETPDERVHIQTAYNVSNMILGYKYDDDIEMRVVDYEDRFLTEKYSRSKYNEYVGQLIRGYGIENESTVMSGNTPLSAPKYLYLFSGIGISIGRLLSFGTVPTYFLGSLLNYIFFVLIIFYSIKKIPIGKVLVLLIAILPMTLQQATSYSYDCGTIALGILLVSLSLKLAYSDTRLKSEIAILLVTMFLFVPVKGCAYFMMVLVALIPIKKMWSKEKKTSRILLAGLILSYCAVIIPMLLNVLFQESNTVSESNIVEWANQPGYTIGQLLCSPRRCLEIIYDTVLTYSSAYIHTMIGGSLGWMVIPVPWLVTLFLLFTLIISAMKVENETIKFGLRIRYLFGFICIISICCIMGALLLGHTPASYTVIQGVQGRYFIPFLILCLFLFRSDLIVIKKNVLKYCVFATVLLQPYIIYSFISYMG